MSTLVFAGGGSGGHIFPALAIAEAARSIDPDVRTHVLCSDRAIDRSILEHAGVPFTPVPARPLSPRPKPMLSLMRSWRPAVASAGRVLDDARDHGPVLLVSTGGFVSVPCVHAARRRRIGVALVNLDRVPGLANRHVARRAGRVFTAAAVDGPVAATWEAVNPIVRPGLRSSLETLRADGAGVRARLGIDPGDRVLAVLGGSQGATSVNRLMARIARTHPGWLAGWAVLHQCGAPRASASGDDGAAELERAYADAGVRAIVRPFFGDAPGPGDAPAPTIAEVWAITDLAVCRAGAGTVAEARAAAVPAAFLPYPHHRDQHQRRNAQPVVEAGGAVLVDDRVEPEATLGIGGDRLHGLLTDAERVASMRRALSALPPCDGAGAIARACLEALHSLR